MEKNRSYDKADYKKKLYDALVESYNTAKDLFASYGEVFLLKRSRDERDKDRDPSARSDRGTKRRKSSKDAESSKDSKSKEKKSSSTSKDASQSQHKSFGKSAYIEEPSHTIEDSGMQQDQEFITRNNDKQPTNKEVTKTDWFKKPERPPTHEGEDLSRRYSTSVTKTKAATYDLKWIEDLMLSTKERLLQKIESLRDGTLDDIRSALNDIAKGIRLEYLPKRKWSDLNKRRARVMIQDIDKKLFERRLMRNLEKFVGGMEYGEDIKLLERKI
ncbi:hypothetical protein Tco_1057612 [Tanacetum coccineum]|uniref:Uncharacterized protein n=1 Tax=Tanacetum coccineum TaxID=301880 RepID=A0ABQ5H5W6_9ASTR